MPRPSSLPTMKYAAVATSKDMERKCININISVRRTVAATVLVDAMPQARPVRSMKKERRYVKDGSGRCQVFLVSSGACQNLEHCSRLLERILTFLEYNFSPGRKQPANGQESKHDSILIGTPSSVQK